MVITKKPHKARLYSYNDNNFFSNQKNSKVTTRILYHDSNMQIIKERRNLLWAFINTYSVRLRFTAQRLNSLS